MKKKRTLIIYLYLNLFAAILDGLQLRNSSETTQTNHSVEISSPNNFYRCSIEHEVMLIARCPPEYSDEDSIRKCEKSLFPSNEEDFTIRIPATNRRSDIHYANPYCAACHNDSSAQLWDVDVACQLPSFTRVSAHRQNQSESDRDREILSTLRYDQTVASYVVVDANNRSTLCTFHAVRPADDSTLSRCSSAYVRECSSSSGKPRDCDRLGGGAVCARPKYIFANAECARCNFFADERLFACNATLAPNLLFPDRTNFPTVSFRASASPAKTLFRLRRSSNGNACSIPAIAKHYCRKVPPFGCSDAC